MSCGVEFTPGPAFGVAGQVVQAANVTAPAAAALLGAMTLTLQISADSRLLCEFDCSMFDNVLNTARTPTFYLRVDGVTVVERKTTSNVGGVAHAFALAWLTPSLAAGPHTVEIWWKDSAGAGGPTRIYPSVAGEGAALRVVELRKR